MGINPVYGLVEVQVVEAFAPSSCRTRHSRRAKRGRNNGSRDAEARKRGKEQFGFGCERPPGKRGCSVPGQHPKTRPNETKLHKP